MHRTRILSSLVALGAVAGLAATAVVLPGEASAPEPDRCHQPGPYQLPQGSEPVDLDPATMSHRITNDYWPMAPGTRWTYRETGGGEVQDVTVTVLERTKRVNGIRARVVHDVVRHRGRVVEDTHDWYAQDPGGALWYLGERTAEYEGDTVSTEGSWEYGVDGAQAGVIVPAAPLPGCHYRQEYRADVAEDRGAVLSVRETLRLNGQRYPRVLTTGDYTRLEPGVVEHKFLARGVGPVLTVSVSPRGGREELVRMEQR